MSLATQIVHWPGKDTFACDKHAAQLRNVANAMGFRVSSTINLSYKIPCENCANEPMESVASIAEREFPAEVAEIKNRPAANLDDDRIRENAWYKECDESARLNKR